MAKVKSFKVNEAGQPKFRNDYDVLKQVVLNFANIEGNNNKFYSMELQKGDGDYRIFTHYGRVGEDGTKEGRYFLKNEQEQQDGKSLEEIAKENAEKEFGGILHSKQRKGYIPIDFAKADVGSGRAKTNGNDKDNNKDKQIKNKPFSSLDSRVEKFVEQIYEEASRSLAKTIKTPLGALSKEQIGKGCNKLEQIRKAIQYYDERLLKELSSQYYSLIPQNFPRRIDPYEAVIDTEDKADRQEEILQLMKDIYNVKDDLDSGIVGKYKAINTKIEILEPCDSEYQRLVRKIRDTESPHHNVSLRVNNILKVEVGAAKRRFNPKKLQAMELFHGSANKNILGILERGLLIAPPCAASTGAAFGRGIYFASNSTKSAQYSTKFYSNIHNNGFLLVADVAVGKMQKVSHFTFSDNRPSYGYDSVMGIKGADLIHDEYIVYNVNQVQLKYVVDYASQSKYRRDR